MNELSRTTQGLLNLSLEQGLDTSPSIKVKEISRLFIAHLSTQQAPSKWPTFNGQTLILEEEKKHLYGILTPEIAKKLYERNSEGTDFYQVGCGKHNIVWGHREHPNIVIKFMNREAARKQEIVAGKALEVIQGVQHSWIQIPRATSIDIDTITAYVEEHLPLTLNMQEHEELWARVLTHYQSSQSSKLFQDNLNLLINHIQLLIEKVGFWDVGYHNLPEVRIDGTGVCGTDFENIDQELGHVGGGIMGLAHLVPISPFIATFLERYEQEIPKLYDAEFKLYQEELNLCTRWGISFDLPPPTHEKIRQRFTLELKEKEQAFKALQTAIQSYDEKGYVIGNEPIANCEELSSLNKEEKELALQLVNKMRDQLSVEKDQQKVVSQKRKILFQPYNGSKHIYTHERFLNVLNALKGQKIIISWSDDYDYKVSMQFPVNYVGYNIYF